MLKVKCITEFEGLDTLLVIVGKHTDYFQAGQYLATKEHAFLNDPSFSIYYDSGIISKDSLFLNKIECKELAEIFKLISTKGSCHYYYETSALKDIELIISTEAYPDEMFEED